MIYETSPSLQEEKTEKTEPGSQTEAKHKRGFGSPEATLTAATLKLLNKHIMQYHQVLNW